MPLNGGDSVAMIGLAFDVFNTMIAFESAINPFMRCAAPAVIKSALLHGAADHSGAAVPGALRE